MVYKKVNHYGIKFYIYEIYEFLLGGCILIFDDIFPSI